MAANTLTATILQLANNGDLEKMKHLQNTCVKSGNPVEWNNHFYKKSGDAIQHIAARRGYIELLRFLYEECENVNFELENLDGKRPLHEAAQACQLDCLQFLISIGVKIDPLKRADWTPLMLACTKSDLRVVRCLVEAGAQLKLRNKDGWTSFHIACREGSLDTVVYLLQCEKELWNTVSKNGRTPLHTAAIQGQEAVVVYLLKLELFQPDCADNCGSTPFMDALRAGFVSIAKMIYEYQQININKRDLLDRHSIHLVTQAGQMPSLKYLVEEMKVDINLSTSNNTGPIHLAAKEGQTEAIEYLISKNVNVNKKDFKGRTALHIAAGALHNKCIKLLLSNGATDCCDSSGIKPSEMVKNNDTIKQLFQECTNN